MKQVINIERKTFTLERRENDRGAFIQIIEESRSGCDMIVIPESGAQEIADALAAFAPRRTP